MRKIPLRKCLATQEQLPKKELIRIVRSVDGKVLVDKTGKVNGRGAYLKKSIDAIALAKKTNVLRRALECEIPDSIYTELLEVVNE
ncbi:MAG: YlxR family protein [Erysipelotrichaceae bacterium]|nr:YlxR family protein [Erysipelotrichaceae bacterium]MDD3923472.1 YlxR family protein [Erysipelotrichaceae bacterium]MDD4642207.1 YlxR family protein [Erysipelotrichaceae bacterium]